jgi:hypothetical protein
MNIRCWANVSVLCFLQNEKFVAILMLILLFNLFSNGALLQSKSLSLEEVHLVRFLTHISQRYFAPGWSLVISSTANYRDVQQELIAEIHRTAIWPVVVRVDGNITLPSKTDFIDKDGSYIILTPGENIKSLQAEIIGLVLGREIKYTRIWNSEAQFVVAAANVFSLSQQTDIFQTF